ncbi:MAG: hypothetical protein V7K69_01460 [Nostoc sp.]|uniref:hypothetical protein n=1 Tax=Nostoc sp. TaxID=1180 RepID=UPI002FF5DD92
MTNLNIIAKLLRSSLIPRKFSYKLWKHICDINPDNKFFFPINQNGKSLIYGRICGISKDALFFNIEEYEQNILNLYKFLLEKDEEHVFIDVGANN